MHPVQIPQKILDANLRRRGRVHAIESIDPKKTSLLVIDMLNAWLVPGMSCEIPEARTIIPNINRITVALRKAGGVVAWTQHSWGPWPNFYEQFTTKEWQEKAFRDTEIGSFGHQVSPDMDTNPADIFVTKNRPSAFIQGSSDLEQRLRARGIDTLIITGTLSNGCCETSARDASALGFRIIFVADGTATRTDEEHNAALINVMQYVADLRWTDEVVALIEGRG